jgi:hypothetical protein
MKTTTRIRKLLLAAAVYLAVVAFCVGVSLKLHWMDNKPLDERRESPAYWK